MKNKKIIIIFSILFLIILFIGWYALKIVKNKKQEITKDDEYVPQEEITDEQYRQTIISLYFVNKETGNVEPEARLIDIRDIINNPYEKILELLLAGPKSNKLDRIIPQESKINKTYTEKDILTIDFSKEFLNYNKDEKNKLIKTIVNTMTELTEINNIKIIIDGNENEEFNEIYSREK